MMRQKQHKAKALESSIWQSAVLTVVAVALLALFSAQAHSAPDDADAGGGGGVVYPTCGSAEGDRFQSESDFHLAENRLCASGESVSIEFLATSISWKCKVSANMGTSYPVYEPCGALFSPKEQGEGVLPVLNKGFAPPEPVKVPLNEASQGKKGVFDKYSAKETRLHFSAAAGFGDALCGGADGGAYETEPDLLAAELCHVSSTYDSTSLSEDSTGWEWVCENGGKSTVCNANKKVVPACATPPHGGQFADAAALNSYGSYCDKGDPSITFFKGDGPWTWTCEGSKTDSVSCMARQAAPSLCGPAHGGSFLTKPPVDDFCLSGSPTPSPALVHLADPTGVALIGDTWMWNCPGISGGAEVSCEAYKVSGPSLACPYDCYRFGAARSGSDNEIGVQCYDGATNTRCTEMVSYAEYSAGGWEDVAFDRLVASGSCPQPFPADSTFESCGGTGGGVAELKCGLLASDTGPLLCGSYVGMAERNSRQLCEYGLANNFQCSLRVDSTGSVIHSQSFIRWQCQDAFDASNSIDCEIGGIDWGDTPIKPNDNTCNKVTIPGGVGFDNDGSYDKTGYLEADCI